MGEVMPTRDGVRNRVRARLSNPEVIHHARHA
jgi:hypothetical protein